MHGRDLRLFAEGLFDAGGAEPADHAVDRCSDGLAKVEPESATRIASVNIIFLIVFSLSSELHGPVDHDVLVAAVSEF